MTRQLQNLIDLAWEARADIDSVNSPELREAVDFLRYYADLDYRTIASVLDVEVGTVSATLSSALTSLRRSLSEPVR